MSTRGGIDPAVAKVLRNFVNALGKASMYPAGHRFVDEAAATFAVDLGVLLEERDAITLGVTPKGLLLDGGPLEPLPAALRQLAQRLHRKNVGTIHFDAGVRGDEVSQMLSALAAGDADESIGRDGLRLRHLRVEPLVYDVLALATDGSTAEAELDDVFWTRLVEAAFGRRLYGDEAIITAPQVAEAIAQRASESREGARRVYEALAGFASALSARGDRAPGSARKRFVEILSALSRPVTAKVVAAAPSTASRRRFLRETIAQVSPAMVLQLLESVAEADGEPVSPHLRWLLGKLAGAEGNTVDAGGAFATQVIALLEQWEGIAIDETNAALDQRGVAEPLRTLAVGLEVGRATPPVVHAAEAMAEVGRLQDVLQLLDGPIGTTEAAATIRRAVLDEDLLPGLLAATPIDWPLVQRIVHDTGAASVGVLLDTLDGADDRSVRRRVLDLLVAMGPVAQADLLARLEGAPWYLARNILVALGQMPALADPAPVLPLLAHDEKRVRQEALKVLLRQPTTRDRAVAEALEGGDPALIRIALATLGDRCPPELVAPVLLALALPDDEIVLTAIRLLGDSPNPLVVPRLLALVRERGGLLRQWRLLPTTPVMLAALELLARRWASHRPVIPVMQLATRSNDPLVRAAIGRPLR
ncbi:MAG TPA: hypothetical protein VFN90_06685 [Gemmatimonadales bacterium]|nr:hypothetical protein [Gemmatimonadales bacterium]